MRILVDMDGVLNLWNDHFIAWVKNLGYDFDEYEYTHNGDWEIDKFIIAPEKGKKIMDNICVNMNFWATIPPDKTAIPVMKELNKKYNIFIATAPWSEDDKYKIDKIKWMKKYFNFIDSHQIILCKKKWEIPGDVIIEDKPETIDKCNSVMYTICHDQPYNKNCNPDYRFSNWNVVPGILQKIEKEMK
jgi:5'(3')-deoxyribonucleotidase